MAKPTDLPRWSDVGGVNVEPSSGKKDVGWATAEKPPAQHLNWLLNVLWQWIEWLDDGDVSFAKVEGTTDVYHGPRTTILYPRDWDDSIALLTNAVLTTEDGLVTGQPSVNLIAANGLVARWMLPMTKGDRLLGIGVTWKHVTGATKDFTAQAFKTTGLDGPTIARASSGSAINATKNSNILRQTHTLAAPVTLASYEALEIFLTNVGAGGAAEVHRAYAVDFTWDRPPP